jgi:glutaredoxin
VKQFLKDLGADFESVEVDLLQGEERKATIEEVKKYNLRVSFPTTVIGDTVVVGDKQDKIKEALKRHP